MFYCGHIAGRVTGNGKEIFGIVIWIARIVAVVICAVAEAAQ